MTWVIVAGSRGFADRDRVHQKLDAGHILEPITRVIHGGCSGPDTFADEWAAERSIPRVIFEADWETHGKAAGPIRNADMVRLGCAERAIVFWDGKSRGTANLINEATKAGISVDLTRQGE